MLPAHVQTFIDAEIAANQTNFRDLRAPRPGARGLVGRAGRAGRSAGVHAQAGAERGGDRWRERDHRLPDPRGRGAHRHGRRSAGQSMFTSRTSIPLPGTLEPKRSVTPSSGCTRTTSAF
jgi:hypothetical protein